MWAVDALTIPGPGRVIGKRQNAPRGETYRFLARKVSWLSSTQENRQNRARGQGR